MDPDEVKDELEGGEEEFDEDGMPIKKPVDSDDEEDEIPEEEEGTT